MKFQLGEEMMEEYLKRADSKEEAWLKFLKFMLESRATIKEKLEVGSGQESAVEEMEGEYREKIQVLLRRSLQSLPKHRHVFFLSRYAVLEYKTGDAATGRTNFENLVSSFPNRVDLWGVYLDMEVKFYQGNLQDVRSLFDRVLGLSKLKMKSAKNIFKKLVKFEEIYGGKGRVQVVKNRAQKYVMDRMDSN
jgi:hypothetical protein